MATLDRLVEGELYIYIDYIFIGLLKLEKIVHLIDRYRILIR